MVTPNLYSSLRAFSRNKHARGDWQSKMPVSSFFLRPLINFLSFKHAGIARLAAQCRTNHRVMDFGAGNGSYSRYFSSRCSCTIIAVDWSPEALRHIVTTKGNHTIFAVCADLHNLPFKSSVFDALFTIDAFGHLRNRAKALTEMSRILKDNTPVFFHSECSDYKTRWPDRTLISKTGRDIPAETDGHISLYNSKQSISLLKEKFNVIRYFSPAGLLGWVLGYPEKYANAFAVAKMKIPYSITKTMAQIKSCYIGKTLMRFVNSISNHIELFAGFSGGGSVFADIVKPTTAKVSETVSIDIIIPTYKRSETLYSLLTTLVTQCQNNDTILVVSQDLTPPQVPPSHRIHLMYSSPANLPKARNRGLLATSNQIVLFLDDDTIPDKQLLEEHRKIYTKKTINCVAGFVTDDRFEQNTNSPSFFNIENGQLIQNFSYFNSCKSISFMGAHFSLRRSILKNILFFDCNFKGNAYWEDIDFAFRLQKAGYPIHFLTNAMVSHINSKHGGCKSTHKAKFLFDYFANTVYFSMKYTPLENIYSWLNYWKYRLEYETRFPTKSIFKHDPVLVLAGCTGALIGCFRFITFGKRIGLPKEVIEHWYTQSNGRQQ